MRVDHPVERHASDAVVPASALLHSRRNHAVPYDPPKLEKAEVVKAPQAMVSSPCNDYSKECQVSPSLSDQCFATWAPLSNGSTLLGVKSASSAVAPSFGTPALVQDVLMQAPRAQDNSARLGASSVSAAEAPAIWKTAPTEASLFQAPTAEDDPARFGSHSELVAVAPNLRTTAPAQDAQVQAPAAEDNSAQLGARSESAAVAPELGTAAPSQDVLEQALLQTPAEEDSTRCQRSQSDRCSATSSHLPRASTLPPALPSSIAMSTPIADQRTSASPTTPSDPVAWSGKRRSRSRTVQSYREQPREETVTDPSKTRVASRPPLPLFCDSKLAPQSPALGRRRSRRRNERLQSLQDLLSKAQVERDNAKFRHLEERCDDSVSTTCSESSKSGVDLSGSFSSRLQKWRDMENRKVKQDNSNASCQSFV